MFKNTMNLVPNGVIVVDVKTKAIIFANKELWDMLAIKEEGSQTFGILKEKVSQFLYHSK